jgi:MFS transporter, DHA2 family, multidrug resistance protein
MQENDTGFTGGVNPWIIAVIVMLATFMEVLDTSVANVALPSIAGNLAATLDESTWVLTSYLVSNAIILPLSGWFSFLFGRKRFYLICVALFTFSSLLCGLAPNIELLVLFRVLQGVGGGALVPISQAILVESFPRAKQGMAMAFFGMGVMFAPIIGPALGGWMTDNFSWRWIFFINIPVGLLAILLASRLVSDPPHMRSQWGKGSLRVDYIGLGLIAVGLGCLQIVLDNGQKKDWFASNTITWLSLIALVALVGTVIWELKVKDPIVDLRLLKERNFCLSTLTMFMVGFVVYASIILYPFYLQNLMGYTAYKSGMVLSPSGLVIFISMPLVGILLTRVEARWLLGVGLGGAALAFFYMSHFNLMVSYEVAVRARMLEGFGEAFLFVPINAAAFYFIAREKTDQGTGLMNLARNVGGSCGIAMVTTMLSRRAQVHQNILVSHVTGLDTTLQGMASSTAQALQIQGADPVHAQQQATALLYGMVQRESAMLAFVDLFKLLGLMLLLMIPLMFFMKKSKPRKEGFTLH